jgi:hypothetical protein
MSCLREMPRSVKFGSSLALFAVALVIPNHMVRADSSRSLLTPQEAEQLALAAARSEANRKLPGLHVEQTRPFPSEAGFYVLEARWNNGGPVGGLAGSYAVDRTTGDVWDAIVCREASTPSVRRLQRAVRKRIGLDGRAYQRLRRPGPMC